MGSLASLLDKQPALNKKGSQTNTSVIWAGIASEFDTYRDNAEECSNAPAVADDVTGELLDEMIERLTGFFRISGTSDSDFVKYISVFFRKNGNQSWCTKWAIIDALKYIFDESKLFVIENWVDTNILSDYNFENFTIGTKGLAKATGQVTFTRSDTTAAVTIASGTQVSDGTNVFVTTEAGTMAIGTATVTVAIQAVVAGTAGNVSIGAITTIVTTGSGADSVTNASATTGGQDAAFGSWTASGDTVSISESDRFEGSRCMKITGTGAVYQDVESDAGSYILLVPYLGNGKITVQRTSDSKYWDFSSTSWVTAESHITIENSTTKYSIKELFIVLSSDDTIRVKFEPEESTDTLTVDYIQYGLKVLYPYIKILYRISVQKGNYLNNWEAGADPVSGVDEDYATFLDNDFIYGTELNSAYQKLIDEIIPAGVKAEFDYITEDAE